MQQEGHPKHPFGRPAQIAEQVMFLKEVYRFETDAEDVRFLQRSKLFDPDMSQQLLVEAPGSYMAIPETETVHTKTLRGNSGSVDGLGANYRPQKAHHLKEQN